MSAVLDMIVTADPSAIRTAAYAKTQTAREQRRLSSVSLNRKEVVGKLTFAMLRQTENY